jgi:hypothetical protein
VEITTTDPWTWRFDVDPLIPGTWSFTFTHDMGVAHATCQRAL